MNGHGNAAVLRSFGAELQVVAFPLPPVEAGALLVQIETATVCGSDVHIWEGDMGPTYKLPLPLIPGHEMVGRIVGIGSGADLDSVGALLTEGDRVVWANAACGHCELCNVLHRPNLCPDRRFVGVDDCSAPPHFLGAFAEYGYVLPGSGRLRVPDAVRSDWASAGSCALRTVINVVEKAAPVDFLDSVVIQGAGPLGLFATAIVATHNPRHLVVVGGPDSRLELASEWGATDVVSIDAFPTPAERLEQVRTVVGSAGPSLVLEVSGARGAASEGMKMLRKSGRIVVAGTLGGPPQSIDVSRITTGELTIVGSMSGGIDSYFKAMRFLERFRDRFDWSRMLGRSYGLHDVTDALRAMKRGEEIKPVLHPTGVAS